MLLFLDVLQHGESLYNVMGKIGGDSDLSARGKQYAKSLPRLIAASLGDSDQLTVSWQVAPRSFEYPMVTNMHGFGQY